MEPSLPRPEGGFATRAVLGATARVEVNQAPMAPAIWPVATWIAERSDELGDLLDDRLEGYVYGRYDNPTNTVLHGAVASLHGGEAAWSFASGMAAIHATLDSLRGDGTLLVTDKIYGGTHALLKRLGRDAGWKVDTADLTDPDSLEQSLTDDHTVVYAETIANPSTAVADLTRLAATCRDRGVALVVDNTFASPYLCRPLELGASAVVESATKYLGGHGDVVGGVLSGPAEVIRAAREFAFEFGSFLGPFEAWLVARGIQTLALRVAAASRSALAVAQALAASEVVGEVRYPGLESHPQHAIATAQFAGRGYGGMLSFELATRTAAEGFADACNVFARASSLGGTRSLVLHPASTSHRQLADADLAAAGVSAGTVRVSVGIEDEVDLIADIEQALLASQTA